MIKLWIDAITTKAVCVKIILLHINLVLITQSLFKQLRVFTKSVLMKL